jgi:hypothetical protein
VEGKLIRGTMEFEEGVEIDPTQKTIPGLKEGKLNARVEVSILVRSLKSGKSSMDSVMQQAMKQKEFPTIEYRMKEMVLKEPHTSGTPFVFDTKGELTVAGVARTNLMQVPSASRQRQAENHWLDERKMTDLEFGRRRPRLQADQDGRRR